MLGNTRVCGSAPAPGATGSGPVGAVRAGEGGALGRALALMVADGRAAVAVAVALAWLAAGA
ncbi:MAG: hypothetical protein JO132_12615 [Streptosporangiaceae bacterium]|nr:hypothetical protein [Streptosporangiaceae bacterium]